MLLFKKKKKSNRELIDEALISFILPVINIKGLNDLHKKAIQMWIYNGKTGEMSPIIDAFKISEQYLYI